MFSIYFQCLTLHLCVSYKFTLMMMMFITYANISGEIYIICCSFEMEEKSSASAEFHSQRFTSANICAPPVQMQDILIKFALHCGAYHGYGYCANRIKWLLFTMVNIIMLYSGVLKHLRSLGESICTLIVFLAVYVAMMIMMMIMMTFW